LWTPWWDQMVHWHSPQWRWWWSPLHYCPGSSWSLSMSQLLVSGKKIIRNPTKLHRHLVFEIIVSLSICGRKKWSTTSDYLKQLYLNPVLMYRRMLYLPPHEVLASSSNVWKTCSTRIWSSSVKFWHVEDMLYYHLKL
jgi:hypothetical protein